MEMHFSKDYKFINTEQKQGFLSSHYKCENSTLIFALTLSKFKQQQVAFVLFLKYNCRC